MTSQSTLDGGGPVTTEPDRAAAAQEGPSGHAGLLLGVGRAAEQGAYGLAMLVLAARMEVAAFGSIAVLFVLNSVALTLADLGLAHDLLRAPVGRSYSRRGVRTQRAVNGSLAVAALVIGVPVGGSTGQLVVLGGLLWWSSGEMYLHQAAALRHGRVAALATTDLAAAVALIGAVALIRSPGSELVVCGAALVVHHLVVVLALPLREGTFSEDGVPSRPLHFLANHTLGFATRNVDYFLAGPLVGPSAFAMYLLGFRVANAPSAPLGAVVLRWGLARFATEGPDQRRDTHRRSATGLFLLGVVAFLVTVGVAWVLPSLLGERWRGAAAIAALIAVALPWRLVDGLVGAVGFTVNAGGLLVRFEAVRLAVTTGALALGAVLGGLAGFVIASVVVTVLAITVGHVLVCRRAGLEPCRWLVIGALPAVVGALALGPGLLNDLVPGG